MSMRNLRVASLVAAFAIAISSGKIVTRGTIAGQPLPSAVCAGTIQASYARVRAEPFEIKPESLGSPGSVSVYMALLDANREQLT